MSAAARFLAVHGHFYQPPREDPVTGEVPCEESAAPHHDWNERIAAECYAPMAEARLLDENGAERGRVSNYERMSFDFGPTLLLWLERRRPDLLAAVVAADRASRERFSGHGAALAHPFHHVILPLSAPRDRRTELLWGVAAFRRWFGREPEGVWFPECAVDRATLACALDLGLRFTVLSPAQADNGVDTGRAHAVTLEDGRRFDVLFFDEALSRGVSFGDLTADAERWFDAVREAVTRDDGTALALIGTDGETFGHHKKFAEMALARLFELADASGDVQVTIPAAFLAAHPPAGEAALVEPSSWSCSHGVERWRADCGCRVEGGSQAWRAPLFEAFCFLRDALAPWFERVGRRFFRDPWAARDAYVNVLLSPGAESETALWSAHGKGGGEADRRGALALLEMQRHLLAMFTSCGWFFDDLHGLEPMQNLAHAARALDLAREHVGADLEEAFLRRLERARGADGRDGRRLFLDEVRPRLGRGGGDLREEKAPR